MVGVKPLTERLPVARDIMVPVLAVLFDYWGSLAAPNGLPEWGGALGSGFRLIDLPTSLLSIMVVVDTGPRDDDFVYRFWGSERRQFLGDGPDPTGNTVAAGLRASNAQNVLSQYKDVFANGTPILVRNTWPLGNGLSAECQTLRLPLSHSATGIGKIVAATAFIRHADEFRKLRETPT